ncbi:hypothetical protein [Spirosoma pollinicola]|uniref:DUF4386 domain-containing protein n=1 Tax=Spirosoma pollinicola TaxID=2057025 RepID=A0A2K8Z0D2_9BACT|nr:hypothetical protein [Spirosoma pollinicola]AUD03309.1 hypothetical protein CWM47_16590 [Spirosoma pollinicola]
MRSQFLTLLCILTFLSCAWGLSDAVVSFLQSDAVAQTIYVGGDEKSKPIQKQDKEPEKKYFEDRSSGDGPIPGDPDQIKLLAIAQFAYCLLTLVGAVMMFRLRKLGFWIYVGGVVIGLVLPVALAGFGALNTSFGVFFSILFAGLYWVSLKEMH